MCSSAGVHAHSSNACIYAHARACTCMHTCWIQNYIMFVHTLNMRACRFLHTQGLRRRTLGLTITWLRLEMTTFCRVGSPPPVPASGTAAGAPGTSPGATPPPARKPVRSFATRARTTGDCWDMDAARGRGGDPLPARHALPPAQTCRARSSCYAFCSHINVCSPSPRPRRAVGPCQGRKEKNSDDGE